MNRSSVFLISLQRFGDLFQGVHGLRDALHLLDLAAPNQEQDQGNECPQDRDDNAGPAATHQRSQSPPQRDGQRRASEEFVLGETIAATPGSVVFQNALMQLIQYTPTTDTAWRRPVLYVGGGVIKAEAAKELREFAEFSGIPVVTTLMALGAFPESHPLHMGMTGM